jgi:hypothetical protein
MSFVEESNRCASVSGERYVCQGVGEDTQEGESISERSNEMLVKIVGNR